MSEIRDEIIRQVERAHSFEGDEHDYVGSDDVADAILALVHDALTSDEAVDAMLYRSYGWADYDKGTTYLDLPEDEKADIRDMGRGEIGAALRAAGVVKGEGNERKGEGNERKVAGLVLAPGVSVVVYNDATWELVNDGRAILDLSRIEDEGYHKVIDSPVWVCRPSGTIFHPPMIRCDEPGNPHVLLPRMRGADHE